MEGTVDVSTISTNNDKRDGHLKGVDFFNADKYPKMTLKLLKQQGKTATIQLTIKDITKTIEMKLREINGPINDPYGNIRTAFELHGEIDRQDFNINFHKLLETGGLIVGNKVKIEFIIEGVLTKD